MCIEEGQTGGFNTQDKLVTPNVEVISFYLTELQHIKGLQAQLSTGPTISSRFGLPRRSTHDMVLSQRIEKIENIIADTQTGDTTLAEEDLSDKFAQIILTINTSSDQRSWQGYNIDTATQRSTGIYSAHQIINLMRSLNSEQAEKLETQIKFIRL